MDFSTFMHQCEQIVETLSEEEIKRYFLYALSKLQPDDRVEFLSQFSQKELPVDLTYESIKEWFEKVSNEEIYLRAEEDESSYSSWDDCPDLIYSDFDDMVAMVEKILSYADSKFYAKKYKEALEIYQDLLTMQIAVESEEIEVDPVDLKILSIELGPKIEWKSLCARTLYACYMVHEPGERESALYHHFTDIITGSSMAMEDVIYASAEPLPGLAEFWTSWQDYLAGVEGSRAFRLLCEACRCGAPGDLERVARSAYRVHPELFRELLEGLVEDEDYEACLSAGQDALACVAREVKVRASYADVVRTAAERLERDEMIEWAALEGFYSDPSVCRMIWLYRYVADASKIAEAPRVSSSAIDERNPSVADNLRVTLAFISGDAEPLMSYLQYRVHSHDWYAHMSEYSHYSAPGEAVSLLLFLLNRNNQYSRVMEALLTRTLSVFAVPSDRREEALDILQLWKQRMDFDLPEETVFELLDRAIKIWLDDIIVATNRNYYSFGAMLLCAWGEIIEGLGRGSRAEFVEHYRKLHNRKIAFKEELGEYC